MIFRAIFWIGLVALLMPHEPDLGYGRPGAHLPNWLPPGTTIQSANPTTVCAAHAAACARGLSLLDRFQQVAVRNLDEVRADLAAHRRAVQPGI
jgi:hypothetical protein